MLSRKHFGAIIAAVVLIFSLGFGIGYLIAKQANPAPIIIEKISD